MIVYLAAYTDFEGDTILGVYSTQEKAEARLQREEHSAEYRSFLVVYVWTVDGDKL